MLAGSALALTLAACSATTYGTGTSAGLQTVTDLVKAGLEYLVLGPVTDDPAQIDLMAKKVMTHFK